MRMARVTGTAVMRAWSAKLWCLTMMKRKMGKLLQHLLPRRGSALHESDVLCR